MVEQFVDMVECSTVMSVGMQVVKFLLLKVVCLSSLSEGGRVVNLYDG
jgi:hypothetical protein